jgi:hypothetical protein
LKHHTFLRTRVAHIRRCAAVALCCIFALVVPASAGAETLRADLDGDGVHDRIEVSRQPGLVAVRLSGTRDWLRFRANDLIVRVVVADVDRDGDSDVVAETRGSGLRFWMNKGRGRFALRLPHLRSRALRAHHSRRIVRGLQLLHDDDNALNDPNRLLAVLPSPLGDVLVAAAPLPLTADAPPARFTHCRRDARGPPPLVAS